MRLRLRRSQRTSGMISSKVVFSLQMQVDLTPDEAEFVKRYKMGKEVLFSKERIAGTGVTPEAETLRGLARNLAAMATILTITINDLVQGRMIECKDILEMLDIEEQIRTACTTFNNILLAAAQFDGDEIIEI